jgi:HSP20 family protein
MNTVTKTEKRPVAEPQREDGQRGYMSPRVNITETKDGYLLDAEMPGVNKDGLEILLEGNELTLVGRRPDEVQGAELIYRESANRDFRRTFVLDPTIDTTKIEARMENGVLHLHLPKAEQVKPRKITVTG